MNENEQAAVAVLLAKTLAFIQLRWENGPRRIYFAVKGHFQAQFAIEGCKDLATILQEEIFMFDTKARVDYMKGFGLSKLSGHMIYSILLMEITTILTQPSKFSAVCA